MPNWCNNILRIKSEDRALLERYQSAINEGILLYLCRPEPEYPGYDDCKVIDGKMPDWWTWRIANWGTKWDIDTDQMGDALIDGDELSVWFCTAWSPPVQALQFAANRDGFSFVLYFDEPGMGFAGRATEDGEDCREYDDIDQETRDRWSKDGFDVNQIEY